MSREDYQTCLILWIQTWMQLHFTWETNIKFIEHNALKGDYQACLILYLQVWMQFHFTRLIRPILDIYKTLSPKLGAELFPGRFLLAPGGFRVVPGADRRRTGPSRREKYAFSGIRTGEGRFFRVKKPACGLKRSAPPSRRVGALPTMPERAHWPVRDATGTRSTTGATVIRNGRGRGQHILGALFFT